MNYAESAQEAIVREVQEEAGLDMTIEGIVGVYRIDNDPRGIHLDIVFAGQATGEVKISDEDRKWQYFPVDALPENIAYKHREAIQGWVKRKK